MLLDSFGPPKVRHSRRVITFASMRTLDAIFFLLLVSFFPSAVAHALALIAPVSFVTTYRVRHTLAAAPACCREDFREGRCQIRRVADDTKVPVRSRRRRSRPTFLSGASVIRRFQRRRCHFTLSHFVVAWI